MIVVIIVVSKCVCLYVLHCVMLPMIGYKNLRKRRRRKTTEIEKRQKKQIDIPNNPKKERTKTFNLSFDICSIVFVCLSLYVFFFFITSSSPSRLLFQSCNVFVRGVVWFGLVDGHFVLFFFLLFASTLSIQRFSFFTLIGTKSPRFLLVCITNPFLFISHMMMVCVCARYARLKQWLATAVTMNLFCYYLRM